MATLLNDARREHQEMRKNKNAKAWETDRYERAMSNGWDYRRFKNKFKDCARRIDNIEEYSCRRLETYINLMYELKEAPTKWIREIEHNTGYRLSLMISSAKRELRERY